MFVGSLVKSIFPASSPIMPGNRMAMFSSIKKDPSVEIISSLSPLMRINKLSYFPSSQLFPSVDWLSQFYPPTCNHCVAKHHGCPLFHSLLYPGCVNGNPDSSHENNQRQGPDTPNITSTVLVPQRTPSSEVAFTGYAKERLCFGGTAVPESPDCVLPTRDAHCTTISWTEWLHDDPDKYVSLEDFEVGSFEGCLDV